MGKGVDLATIQAALNDGAAALRSRTRLQPSGGDGDKVFPPTYAGGVYAREERRLPGRDEAVECVLIDSVQSQANRMEEALQDAVDSGRLALPIIEVDFSDFYPGEDHPEDLRLLNPVGSVSSLQAPHRIADAILRDSLHKGQPFRESEVGRQIDHVSLRNATPLFKWCPTALVFGMWDSTGPKGGLGAKFERAMVSEIVGVGAKYGVKTSSRIDPLGIERKAGPIFEADTPWGWTLDESKAKTDKKKKPVTMGKDGRPSEANHGNVAPSLSERDRQTKEYLGGGVTLEYAEQTTVISLPALKRLRFPLEGTWAPSKEQTQRDRAGQAVLIALGLCAAELALEAGLDLRSRCLLWSNEPVKWSLLQRGAVRDFELSADGAIELLNDAVKHAASLGLEWITEPVHLRPCDDLVRLVVRSQQLTAEGSDAGDER